MQLSALQQRVVAASELGYTVTRDGVVLNPKGMPRKTYTRKYGGRGSVYLPYAAFSVRVASGNPKDVLVHRLVAYQKFGVAAFQEGIVVRHLDGDSLNNASENIAIGTHQQNALDRDPEVRRAHAQHAAMHRRKLTSEKFAEFHADREAGMSMNALAVKYGIAKSTVSYIVNGKTYRENRR